MPTLNETLDEQTAQVFGSLFNYYVLGVLPSSIAVVAFFSFLAWFGIEFFVNN
jgi:hypothetical protein